MQISYLVEFLQAAHLAQMVEGDYSDEPCGVALVAPPEQLKTTLVKAALEDYPNAMVLSDANVIHLNQSREMFLTGRYRTIAFLDFQKVYERDQRSASNVEGCIRALIAEGWQGLSHQSQLGGFTPAKAFCVLCVTPSMLTIHGQRWIENGFWRRFLWLRYCLSDVDVIFQAIKTWKKLRIGYRGLMPWPQGGYRIPNDLVTSENKDYLETAVKDQIGGTMPQHLLQRIFAVLKWHYETNVEKDSEVPLEIIRQLLPLMKGDGGRIDVAPLRPQLVSSDKKEPKERRRG